MQPENQAGATISESEATAKSRKPYFDRLKKAADSLARRMDPSRSDPDSFSAGEMAELRRLDVAKGLDGASPTFWRVVIDVLEDEKLQLVPHEAPDRELFPWLGILQCWAELAGFHRHSQPLGASLAEAKVAEMRVVRLLRARDAELYDQVRKISHQLRSSGQMVDFVDIAQLTLSDDSEKRETVRRYIASRFYRRQHKLQKSGSSAS